MKLTANHSLRISHKNPNIRYPGRNDYRCRDSLLIPSLKPKFHIDYPVKIFTIGSCFARNIEEALSGYDVQLPTRDFSAPRSEWPYRHNGLLNEFNPGIISQRILSAMNGEPFPEETIVQTRNGFIDLLLPASALPVTYERTITRRTEIDKVYSNLVTSELVIITLGLVEAWFDNSRMVFLNRMPYPLLLRKHPDQYSLRILANRYPVESARGRNTGANRDIPVD
jgi:GSCFA family.